MACLVRMGDEVLLLHNWDNNYLFCSVDGHDFESPWLANPKANKSNNPQNF